MTTPKPLFIARPIGSRRPRGISLVEALVALVVLGFGTVAIAELHGRMQGHADVARQRTEAVRLADEAIEELRAFTQMAPASGAQAYASIGDDDRVVDGRTGHRSHTVFRVARRIDDTAIGGAKAASIAVSWQDRHGATERIVIDSLIGANDPMYSGALTVGAGAGATRSAFGRAPAVPVDARDLGDGRSIWKATPAGSIAFVFDNASGYVVGRCVGIAASTASRDLDRRDLHTCDGIARLFLSGTIRFTQAVPADAADANDPPLPVELAVSLSGGAYPAPAECFVTAMRTVRQAAPGGVLTVAVPLDATPASLGVGRWTETGERFARYRCAVAPRTDGRWSGRVDLVPAGWTIGSGSVDRRVCRFVADLDGSGAIDAHAEHPADHVDVAGPLGAQNFLVVGGGQACPAIPPTSGIGAGRLAHAAPGTAPHQP